MKNDSIFNRIPLPLMIVIWLGLVAVGAVLVYTVFFSQPADSTSQAAAQKTPTAQARQRRLNLPHAAVDATRRSANTSGSSPRSIPSLAPMACILRWTLAMACR